MHAFNDVNGLELARAIVAMPQDQAAEVVHQLRATKRLSPAVRSLNQLLQSPDKGDLARAALERMGFPVG